MSDIREFPITGSAFVLRRLLLEIAIDKLADQISTGPVNLEWLAAHSEKEQLHQRHDELMEAA